MNPKSKFIFGAMCALFCSLCISKEALGHTPPNDKGKAEFIHNCTACHRADLVTRVRKTPEDWRKSVDDMAARGTDGSKEDLDNVVLYLVTNFAADKPGSAATPSTAPSSTSNGTPALNASEMERVKHVITENGCLTCHRIEKQGTSTGPTLNGLGARLSASEIRAAIVSPHHTLKSGDPNPAPSFEGKITGEDLDNLVRYLSSLPSVDETIRK